MGIIFFTTLGFTIIKPGLHARAAVGAVMTKQCYIVFVLDDSAIPICPDVRTITSNRVARNGGGSWGDLKLRGLVDDEWTIESRRDPDHNSRCHKDDSHELVYNMMPSVHEFIVRLK
jgi:hypothetical protein